MKYSIAIAVLMNFMTMLSVKGQTEIEFQNKSLLRSLNKAGIQSFEEMKELGLDGDKSVNLSGKYFQIEKENTDKIKYIYIGRVNSCRAGGCSLSGETTTPNLDSEYFDYFIFFDSKKAVQLVKVFNYQATHGHEITSRGWLKQFEGHSSLEPLLVDKNIDSISGATISVYAITNDIEIKTEMLNKLVN